MSTLADDLRRALSRLVAPHTHRLTRDDDRVERVTLPSLLDLLQTAVACSTGGRGGRTSPKSKPPIDVALLDLLAEIDDVVADACREHDLELRYAYRDEVVRHREVPDPAADPGRDRLGYDLDLGYAGPPVRLAPVTRRVVDGRDVAGNLRQLVPALIAHGGIELVEWWVEQLNEWATRAEGVVGDRQEGGALVPVPMPCPDCGAEKVTREEDGETYRSPALVAVVREHEVRMLSCGACGMTWHRGPALDALLTGVLGARAAALGVVRTADEIAAAALREWAAADDEIGWPGSPEVAAYADELAAFLADRGLLAERPVAEQEALVLDQYAREFTALAAGRKFGRGSWRAAAEHLTTAASERRGDTRTEGAA